MNNYLIFGLGWVFGAISTWLVIGLMFMNKISTTIIVHTRKTKSILVTIVVCVIIDGVGH